MKWMRHRLRLLIFVVILQFFLIGLFTFSAFLYRANLEIFHSLDLRGQELPPNNTGWQLKSDILQQIRQEWWSSQLLWGLILTIIMTLLSYLVILKYFQLERKKLMTQLLILLGTLAFSLLTLFIIFYSIKSSLWQHLLDYCSDYYQIKLNTLTPTTTNYLHFQQPRILPFNIDSLTHVYISNPLTSKTLLVVILIGTLYYLLLVLIPIFSLTKFNRRRKKVSV